MTLLTLRDKIGCGDGSIRLDLIEDDSIVDAGGHPLAGGGAGNGNFSGGETHTIDKTPPVLSSIVRAKAEA